MQIIKSDLGKLWFTWHLVLRGPDSLLYSDVPQALGDVLLRVACLGEVEFSTQCTPAWPGYSFTY